MAEPSVPDSTRAAIGGGFAFICLVMACVSIALPRSTPLPEPDFTTEGWRPDPVRLAPARAEDEELRKKYPLDAEDARPTLGAFFALGTAEAKANGRTDDPEYARATEEANNALNDYWFRRGKERFQALGLHVGDRFVAVVYEALGEASKANLPILAWLRDNPAHPVTDRLHAHAGDFVRHAVDWGLITRQNEIVGRAESLLRIHFEVRWARFVTDILDYTMLLHPEELRALWRWRVEGDVSLGMKARLRAAKRLRRIDPDYPIYSVLGRIQGRRGRYREAIAFHREALLTAPFDRRLRDNLIWLLEAAARSRTIPPPA